VQLKVASKKLASMLLSVPKHWDGKQAIEDMRNAGFPHWRQMEWIGFYFQFLCAKHLAPIMRIPGPRYGNVEFDGLYKIPWDFKAHAMSSARDFSDIHDAPYGAYGAVAA
jgi:hypothetical protein